VKALRQRHDVRSSESGLSLIEVIIAMMVFALIATGVGYTMIAALRLTQDSTARQQAANLASQEIDLTRSIDNLFNLVDKTTTETINGITYTIKRTARWVSDPNVDQRCGVGGGILRYKRVNVTVGWTGMTSDLPTVRADTLIDPGVRINDPDLGTVLISVSDSSGEPVAGATVTVTPGSPANGANPLAAQPPVTDSLGCTYALMVDPGNYDVTVSKSGYVDITQDATPTVVVSVEKSSASAAMATLDLGATFPISYATNYAGSATLPNNIDASFISTYGTSLQSGGVSSVTMFPFPAGYEVLAGIYNDPANPSKTCKSVEPAEWSAGTAAGVTYLAGVRPTSVAAIPGGTAPSASVPMGVVTVQMPNSRKYLVAVSQSTGPSGTADPGCETAMTYTFGRLSRNEIITIALPFGSWKLYAASNSTGTDGQLDITSLTPLTAAQETASGNILTLDPRQVAP
jgi:prepilin-type N-terminal cleavage/methylation domain-containing protein